MSISPDTQTATLEKEIKNRVAILRHFKELLFEQRQRFKSYLEALDKQKTVIESGTTEDLISHVELQEMIVADIFSIQKAVQPMQTLYKAVWKDSEAPEITEITTVLDSLKVEAVKQARENKELLQKRLVVLRDEMKNLRNSPFKVRKSVYADQSQPSLIDIKG